MPKTTFRFKVIINPGMSLLFVIQKYAYLDKYVILKKQPAERNIP